MKEEKVVQIKQCKLCNFSFKITDKDLEFYDKISPVFSSPDSTESGLKKFQIPTPTLCPDCRQQRRLSWRNERKLYRRKSDITGKDVVSIYSPDKKCRIYESSYWWGDKWNALDYGKNFDFNRSFFEQFSELLNEIPRLGILNSKSENSDYCNNSLQEKKCYLSFIGGFNENCMYTYFLGYSKDCLDILWGWSNENCYEGVKINKCYKCFYCINCAECTDCECLIDSIGSKNCSYSIGLINKEYHFLNNKYDKKEYEEIKIKLKNDSEFFIQTIKKFDELKLNFVYKNITSTNSVSVEGNYFTFSNNCINCFDCDFTENVKFAFDGWNLANSYDTSVSGAEMGVSKGELIYDSENLVNCYKTLFCSTTWNCNNMFYSDTCFFCNNCFGCIGLVNKEYCVLNKQYTKDEYNKLLPKILEYIQETGEIGGFFPANISLFGYNETVAMEYFPLNKEQAIKQGFNRSNYNQPFPKVEKIIPANKLPENIKDIPNDILNWAIECEITKKPFRIIKQELEFYRKHNLGVPKRHPDQRHLDRMKLRNPRKLYDRECDKCGKNMKTTYYPNSKEIVYCEECYNMKIY